MAVKKKRTEDREYAGVGGGTVEFCLKVRKRGAVAMYKMDSVKMFQFDTVL